MIPGILLFLFLAGAAGSSPPQDPASGSAGELPPDEPSRPSPGLAQELFESGEWDLCRRECRRHLLRHPGDPAVGLMLAVTSLRTGRDSSNALAALAGAAGIPAAVSAMAAYELGREYWRRGLAVEALPRLRQAFETAPAHDIFLHAGCSLHYLLRDHPDLADSAPGLAAQLASCSHLWTRAVRTAARLPRAPRRRILTRPGEWVIAFYRTQISPAIGRRCSLHPTCSAYAVQALHQHGLLGFTMYADRGVREPGVVAAKARPVPVNGALHYADPLEDHDWWME